MGVRLLQSWTLRRNFMNSLLEIIKTNHEKRDLEKKQELLSRYRYYYDSLEIDDEAILIESAHGESVYGNMYYILKELATSTDYVSYKKYVVYRNTEQKNLIINKLSTGKNIIPIKYKSDLYYKVLASAKFLFNDTSFGSFYIKKDGQIYLNTWHGTPLKHMGRKHSTGRHTLGNIQRNFLMADYILFPNDYSADIMIDDYMIRNLYNGKYIFSGYPRNTELLKQTDVESIKQKLNLTGKKIYTYMPTWREDDGIENVLDVLKFFNEHLENDEVLYTNIHILESNNINLDRYKKVKPFPKNFETYEFLKISDCLITDYSSVMFDFAITGRKIVLYTYDEDEYINYRGLYIDLAELPFPNTKNVESLIDEIRTPKQYNDNEIIKKYCQYENIKATKNICDLIIKGECPELEVVSAKGNGKKNVLIFSGNLAQNGITVSLLSLLKKLDRTKYNYYVTFGCKSVSNHLEQLDKLYELVDYIPMQGGIVYTNEERNASKAFKKDKTVDFQTYWNDVKGAFELNIKRLYPNFNYSAAIQFNGYDTNRILEFSLMDAKKTIYVHNDMVREIEDKGYPNKEVLEYAYSHYDNVAIVTEAMRKSTEVISKRKDNIIVANNVINKDNIINQSKKKVSFDDDTISNYSLGEILDKIKKSKIVFVNVGRFSQQKGQDRLIKAFAKYHEKHKESTLMIIGGYEQDNYYSRLLELGRGEGIEDCLIMIKSMSNPYPLIKQADGFVLSSLYEGFGLVLAEANILGLPIVSTDIDGPRAFMKENGATLVEDSEDGILQGLELIGSGKEKYIEIDYNKYNQHCIEQFEGLLV